MPQNLLDLASYVSVGTGTIYDLAGPHIIFSGANVHIQNGSGSTEHKNGLGNLIVGYDETIQGEILRDGSHNLVVGGFHGYSSYGGLVVGFNNIISGPSASVSGGFQNTASDFAASVSGGRDNQAGSWYASVSGGFFNRASHDYASVSGGRNNQAGGVFSSVSGGSFNTASGESSTVSGGINNTASGLFSTVSGGANNATDVDLSHLP